MFIILWPISNTKVAISVTGYTIRHFDTDVVCFDWSKELSLTIQDVEQLVAVITNDNISKGNACYTGWIERFTENKWRIAGINML